MPEITLLYAGILGLIAVAVAFPAGRLRGATGISVGDGGNPELTLAMRRHANFAESVPILLILLALLELNGVGQTGMHAMGGLLTVFRIAHAIGLKTDNISHPARGIGAGGTALLTIVAAGWAIYLALT